MLFITCFSLTPQKCVMDQVHIYMKFCFLCIYSVLTSSGLKEIPESDGIGMTLFNTQGSFLFPNSIPVGPGRASM